MSKVELSVRGRNGRDGQNGAAGKSYGERGQPASSPTAGQRAGQLQVNLGMDSKGQIVVSGSKTMPGSSATAFEEHFENPPDLYLDAEGGRGGDGADGGDGANGRPGYDGSNATPYSFATAGGDGDPGGDGGVGSSGADGADGGIISISAADQDLALLPLADQYSVAGGRGGIAGHHGVGGRGGRAGVGGSGCTWTTPHTTYSNGKSETTYQTHSRPGAPDGLRGYNGKSPSSRLEDGTSGINGSISYTITEALEKRATYQDRYRILTGKVEIVPTHPGGIIEPGSRALVGAGEFKNVGPMITPQVGDLEFKIYSGDWGQDEDGVNEAINRRLKARDELDLKNMAVRIKDRKRPARGERFVKTYEMTTAAYLRRIDRALPESIAKTSFVVTYPVEITPIAGDSVCLPNQPAQVQWQIKNISSATLGRASEGARIVKSAMKFVGGENVTDKDVIFTNEQGEPMSLAEGIHRAVDHLPPGGVVTVKGTVSFRDGVDAYNHVFLETGLDLGKVSQPDKAKTIQQRSYSIQLAERYFYTPGASVLLVVDDSATKEEVDAWKQLAESKGKLVNIWNTDVYDAFSLTKTIKRSGRYDLGENFEDKTVVLLSNRKNGQTIAARSDERELLTAAHTHGLATYVVGDREELSKPAMRLEVPIDTQANSVRGSYQNLIDSLNTLHELESLRYNPQAMTYGKPSREKLLHQADTLRKNLRKLFPDRDYQVTARYAEPVLVKKRFILPNTYEFGTIEIARSVDKGHHVQALSAPSEGKNSKAKPFILSAENQYRFIKAMNFGEKLRTLYHDFNYQYPLNFKDKILIPESSFYSVNQTTTGDQTATTISAILSDLAEEQDWLQSSSPWLGRENAATIGNRLERLNKLVEHFETVDFHTVDGGSKALVEQRKFFVSAIIAEVQAMSRRALNFWDYILPFRRRWTTYQATRQKLKRLEKIAYEGIDSKLAMKTKAILSAIIKKRTQVEVGAKAGEPLTNGWIHPKHLADDGFTTDFDLRRKV